MTEVLIEQKECHTADNVRVILLALDVRVDSKSSNYNGRSNTSLPANINWLNKRKIETVY
jgi:hypothetical protein